MFTSHKDIQYIVIWYGYQDVPMNILEAIFSNDVTRPRYYVNTYSDRETAEMAMKMTSYTHEWEGSVLLRKFGNSITQLTDMDDDWYITKTPSGYVALPKGFMS